VTVRRGTIGPLAIWRYVTVLTLDAVGVPMTEPVAAVDSNPKGQIMAVRTLGPVWAARVQSALPEPLLVWPDAGVGLCCAWSGGSAAS
jgi:hypothetical protein